MVNLSNYAHAKELLLATPLGRLAESPEIADALEDARKEQMAAFEALADELAIDVEAWPEPEGMVGFALVTRPVEGAEEWEPQITQSFVAGIDFGDGITEIQRIVDAVVEKGLDQGLIEVATEDMDGVEVLTITVIPQEVNDGDSQPGDPGYQEPSGLRSMLSGLDHLTLAIMDSTLLLGAEPDLVMDLLDRAQGSDLPAIADNDQFAAALAQHPAGTTDYAVVMPGRVGLIEGFSAGLGFFLPPGLDITQILASLGITGMKAVSLGANLESVDAQAEITIGILDPEKTSLVSLLDLTSEPWDPPSFVTPDAIASTRLLFDFARLPDVAREFVASLPQDMQDQVAMPFEQAMALVEPIAPLLGPEVYIIQTLERPFAVESAGQVFVIPTSNELPLKNLLVMASGGGALAPRDFAGGKIYDDPNGALSVSVAFGHLFIGTPVGLEGALRLASAENAQDLGDEPAFQDAMQPHASTGNAVQYTRLLDILEYTIWAAQNTREIAAQGLRDAGIPEADIQDYLSASPEAPQWLKDLTIETLARGLGDISMEISPSDDGFRGRILVHEPR